MLPEIPKTDKPLTDAHFQRSADRDSCLHASHCVQGSSSSHVRQEANFQHMEQEVLIVDAVHSVQEQHHGGLVVWHKTRRHLWLNDLTICGLSRPQIFISK